VLERNAEEDGGGGGDDDDNVVYLYSVAIRVASSAMGS
jgi:hypothetical protein